MKKPNFFIIGGAKCGTTSLNNWLDAHPQIYMSPYKEPNYFSTDIQAQNTKTMEDYEQLFQEATESHLFVGEASVHYMYSEVAIQNILTYNPAAKFVVMIRNPADMAYSLHQHEFYATNEREKSFEKAWDLQQLRKQGKAKVPSYCDVKLLLYGERCQLGHQLERLYAQVDASQIHVIVLDDIKQDVRTQYQKLLQFLGVADNHPQSFPIYNEAKTSKYKLFDWGKVAYRYVTKNKSTHRADPTWIKKLKEMIKKNNEKVPMNDNIRKQLSDYYKEDIKKLSKLLHRDFSNWMS